MTQVVAKLLLAGLLLPLSGMLLLLLNVVILRRRALWWEPAIVWCAVSAFIALYWILLWRKEVSWSPRRKMTTVVAAVVSIVLAYVAVLVIYSKRVFPLEESIVFGGGIAPIVWIWATVLIWRESPAERIARIRAVGIEVVACPFCGYNMTGLFETRCPECGGRCTLEEILAAQRKTDEELAEN